MADTDIIVSEMTPASQINTGDLMIMTQPDAQAETGYSTKSATVLQVTNKQLKGIDFPTDLPSFNNPKVLGGLEELKADIKALLPVSSAIGNPCTFETNLADKLVSLKAAILASGGNGTPATPNPIVGHSEINLDVNGDTFTVSFGQTVYGGMYDANRGKVRITYTGIDMGYVNWDKYNTEHQVFFKDISGMKSGGAVVLCSCYVTSNWVGIPNIEDLKIEAHPTLNYVYIRDDNYTSAADFKMAVTGQTLMYELATPIEIDVPALSVDTIVGVNNIVSDCGGDVEVQYRDSIQHYIDKKIAETQALIL